METAVRPAQNKQQGQVYLLGTLLGFLVTLAGIYGETWRAIP